MTVSPKRRRLLLLAGAASVLGALAVVGVRVGGRGWSGTATRSAAPAALTPLLQAESYQMVRIEPGAFGMGSPLDEPGRYPDEVQHDVRLTHAFFIGVTEVTAQLWQRVEGQLPPEHVSNDPRRAVTNVTWFAAVSFCNHLSVLENLVPAYTLAPRDARSGQPIGNVTLVPDASGYRLPTEAEWEYAARANGPGLYANDTVRVNAWGLYDMSGNLWEWVWDRPGAYPGSAIDPTGPDHGYFHVLRGGSWRSPAAQRRVAMRGWSHTFSVDDSVGLRIVRTAP
ncbi:MAG: formylglycine-generating enzyme family protein [Pseudomonadota bacterium]|nr:formylglycine-generating enzyme family protein [Pseudomonadota bacterium]